MKASYSINFEREKNDKLYFYEKSVGNKVTEFAYISPEDPDIHYKTDEGDIKKFPKEEIVSFLINIYNDMSKIIFNERVDLKSKSSKPRFGLKIQGKSINLIHFFIINKGLLSALDYFNIRYQFSDKKVPGALINLRLNENEDNHNYLGIFNVDLIQEYLINGLHDGLKSVFPVDKKDINSKELYNPFFELKGRNFASSLIELNRTFIDQTTAKILKTYGMPSDLMDLLGKFVPKYLMNAKTEDQSDLGTQRIRMSEAVSHSAYRVFGEALGRVRNIKGVGTDFDTKLILDPLAIIKRLQASGMLQYSQTTNPMEELNFSSKITKTGVGNMLAQQVTLKKRDLNPSYYGVIAPVSTNEYSNVGNTQTLTNKATLTDRFGTIQQREFTDDINPFDLLSASESLQPFYEYDDTTRRVMGNQQFGQFVQLDNPDEPLVQTSFEEIVPHLVSDRFTIKAKKKGIVKSIKDNRITIVNSDGTLSHHSTKDTRSRTKRGIYIPMKYHVIAKDGQHVKPGDILAATSSLKTGKLAVGRNLVVAQMSYRGMNYEDGWVITEPVQDKYDQKILEKITAIIPLDAKIADFKIMVGEPTDPGEVLLTYSGVSNVEDFIVEPGEDSNTDDVLSGIEFSGSNVIYRSPGGRIIDFNIKLNNKNVDSLLYKEWRKLTKDIESQQQQCKLVKHNHTEYVDCISDITNPEIIKIGGHSVNGNEFDGAVIEIFIEKPNKVANGSKFTLGATGGKGTVQYIIPKGQEPHAEDTKLKIEFIPTPLSIISRKNISILLLMYTGKVVYFLNKKALEMAESGKVNQIREMVLEIFSYMDASSEKFLVNEIGTFFDSKSDGEIIKYIKNSDPLSKPAFPMLVPPHKNKITIENIQDAANALGIPLNEKVYIPEEGIYTEQTVPVGIMPVTYLEHFPKAMSGVRGSLASKSQFTTGQGRSGTSVGAGASKIGEYDLFALSYKEPGKLIKELHGLHSDNKEGKMKFQKMVLKDGKMPDILNIKIDSSEGKTKQLVETFFHGAMLESDL